MAGQTSTKSDIFITKWLRAPVGPIQSPGPGVREVQVQNMHPYRITPGTDIASHVGTTYPALPGPPAVPETYLLIRHSGGAQEWGSDGRHGCGRPGPTHHSGCRQGGWGGRGPRGGGHSGHVLSVLFIGVVDEVELQEMTACMLAVLAV